MSINDIKIPSTTLAELRGVLVRALSRENLSVTDKIAIRKSQSASTLKIHYTWNYSGTFAPLRLCAGQFQAMAFPFSSRFVIIVWHYIYLFSWRPLRGLYVFQKSRALLCWSLNFQDWAKLNISLLSIRLQNLICLIVVVCHFCHSWQQRYIQHAAKSTATV